MEIRELLNRLERHRGSFPADLLDEAVARREEITPKLLGILEDIDSNPEIWQADDSRFIHIHAVYLPAFFRETRAYPLITRIFARPGEFAFDVFGDVTTQSLSPILASVCGGDVSSIKLLIEDEDVNEWVRACALSSLVSLVAAGLCAREEVMSYIGRLFGTLKQEPSAVRNSLAYISADLWPQEVLLQLRWAYDEGLVSEDSVGWDDIEESLALGKEEALRKFTPREPLVSDLSASMGWMTAFQPKKTSRAIFERPQVEDEPEDVDVIDGIGNELFGRMFDGAAPEIADSFVNEEQPVVVRRTLPKTGRNERCPCGSGKKYKKCCGVS